MPWALSPKTFLFAAGVGIIGGLVGTSYQLLSRGLQHAFVGPGTLLDSAQGLPWWKCILIPFLGACVASALVFGLGRWKKGQGMAAVMEAVSLRRVRSLSVTATIARALSSLALIATGGSVGREGPIAYLSASFGLRFARMSGMPSTRLGLFAGCGIAAGMAVSYYAPFGAALFAMEVVLRNFSVDILAPVLVSSIVSYLMFQALATIEFIGANMNKAPLYDFSGATDELIGRHPWEYLLYILLGVATAIAGILLLKALKDARKMFGSMHRIPPWAKIPLGGLIVGLIGIGLPQVWGNGYHAVNLIINNTPALWLVGLIVLGKIFATSITLGSGGSGGMFTPTLFVGAAGGLFFGEACAQIFPDIVANPKHYAIVGMAGAASATTHAPIMAIVLLFEMTRETELFLPMLVGAISATVTSRALGIDSVYLEPLKRKGIHIPESIEETALTTTPVSDIMRTQGTWVRENAPFDMIVEMVRKTRRDFIYVTNGMGALVGVIHLHDIKGYLADSELGPAIIAADLAVETPRAYPNQTLAETIRTFDDPEVHELPVVDPATGMLIGVVDRRDFITVLSVEVLDTHQIRAKFIEPGGAQHFVELPEGHGLARIPVPEDCHGRTLRASNFRAVTGLSALTVIRHDLGKGKKGKETRLLPDPNMVLQAGDDFIVMGSREDIEALTGNDE
ncbi:MAG: chloride channel protein [Planctomycetota bacterium]